MPPKAGSTRNAHAAIGAALRSTEPHLPPNHTGFGTTYDVMKFVYKDAAGYSSLRFAYGEMHKFHIQLRGSLRDFYAGRGIPPKLTECLDEMGAAINHAIAVDGDKESLQGIAPEPKADGKGKSVLVSEWQHEQVKAELAQAKREIEKLKKENEELRKEHEELKTYAGELHAQRAQAWGL